MQAKKCDRCGTLYEIYNTKSDRKKCNGLQLLNIDGNQKYWSQGVYDLCPECMEGLMRWLYAIKNGRDK